MRLVREPLRTLVPLTCLSALVAVAVGWHGDDPVAAPGMSLSRVDRTAARSAFLVHRPVTVPRGWRLIGVSSASTNGTAELVGMDFGSARAGGPLMVVTEQAAGGDGERLLPRLRRSRLVGTVTAGGGAWDVYDEPSTRGTMVAHTYGDAVSLVMYGDGTVDELRPLMAAFSNALVVGSPAAA